METTWSSRLLTLAWPIPSYNRNLGTRPAEFCLSILKDDKFIIDKIHISKTLWVKSIIPKSMFEKPNQTVKYWLPTSHLPNCSLCV